MRLRKRNPYYGMGLDKRQARRAARRNNAKVKCTCGSLYENEYGNRVHYEECGIIQYWLGY